MSFAENLENWQDKTAIIGADGETIGYARLAELADAYAQNLGPKHSICLIRCSNRLPSLLAYLACLRHQRVALLVDNKLPDSQIQNLADRFGVGNIVAADGTVQINYQSPTRCRPDLALLLSTSGSTGSPKLVMLSAANLQANADSIRQYLPLLSSDTAMAHLPLHYSYGLSVINSHLLIGATISLTEASPIGREFWAQFQRDRISSFSGVPQHYHILKQLRFERMQLPHLRYFTQAGGKLASELVCYFAELAAKNRQLFYVMYGQTEATARMAYLPPALALRYPDSIGQAIPNGQLWLQDATGKIIDIPDTPGELFYRGPNVMLGYAEHRGDLLNDNKLSQLATGDLACINNAGLFNIVGRLNRYLKMYGRRINLDELEHQLANQGFEVRCAGTEDRLLIACLANTLPQTVKQYLFEYYQFHPIHVKAMALDTVPLTASGKTDYQQLQALIDD